MSLSEKDPIEGKLIPEKPISDFQIVPVEGENYEGRQWGWHVRAPDGYGTFVLHLVAGGTGPCWNLAAVDEDEETELGHFCSLDDLIAALQAFADSDERKREEARWD